MKLLVDMNLSPRWVDVLRGEGFDVVHWSAVGLADATDSEIMAHARAHRQVVLTHDLDFGSILAATHGKEPSVVQIRSQIVTPEAIGTSVITALRQMETELQEGALVTVDPKRTRLHILPLRTRD